MGASIKRFRPKVTVVSKDKVETFDDEIEAPAYPRDGTPYCGAVFFKNQEKIDTDNIAEYEIRLNNTLARFETMRPLRSFPDQAVLRQYQTWTNFLDLQRITDDFITCSAYAQTHGCLDKESFTHGVDTDTRLLSFPTPEFTINRILEQVAGDFSGNVYFAMAIGAFALSYHILKERESKVREGMKAMGALESVIYLENFIFNVFWTIPTSLGVALISCQTTGEAGFYTTTTWTFFVLTWLT